MMRTLNDREKRTVRYASIGIAIYLVLFFGVSVRTYLETKRADYQKLVARIQDLKNEIRPYQDKAVHVKKLMESSRLDPAKLSRATVVAEASAAIQSAAAAAGIQVGPVRENPAHTSSKELASVQIEGSGAIPAVMSLLHNLESLGYPLVIDSVQLSTDPMRPGQVKLNLTIIVLDFNLNADPWKDEATPHA
jgi:hypothetical protein